MTAGYMQLLGGGRRSVEEKISGQKKGEGLGGGGGATSTANGLKRKWCVGAH